MRTSAPSLRAEGEAIQANPRMTTLDCFAALAMTSVAIQPETIVL